MNNDCSSCESITHSPFIEWVSIQISDHSIKRKKFLQKTHEWWKVLCRSISGPAWNYFYLGNRISNKHRFLEQFEFCIKISLLLLFSLALQFLNKKKLTTKQCRAGHVLFFHFLLFQILLPTSVEESIWCHLKTKITLGPKKKNISLTQLQCLSCFQHLHLLFFAPQPF